MEHFAEIVNNCSCFCKPFSQYQILYYFNKNQFLLQKYLFYIKKIGPQRPEVLNVDIPILCCKFIFIKASEKKQDVSKNMPCYFLLTVK